MVEKLPLRCVVLVGLVLVGCNRTGAVCPEDMKIVKDRSEEGRAVLCKSSDGRAQWVEFHPGKDGGPGKQRRQVCLYRGGHPDGPFQSWHPGGKKWVEGSYQDGQKVGHWNQWNPEGVRVADGDYREGRLVAGAPVGMVARCESISP
jgi:hypothetical protein